MMYTQSSPVDTLNMVKAALPAAAKHAELQQQYEQEKHIQLRPCLCNAPKCYPIKVTDPNLGLSAVVAAFNNVCQAWSFELL